MDSAMQVVLPYCKYNYSLNKYLLFGSSLDIDLDNFNFYQNYNLKLSFIKRRFLNLFCFEPAVNSPQSIQNRGKLSPANPEHLLGFAKFILRCGVNPFLQIWEVTLANWPLFPATTLLDCCRTQKELQQEANALLVEKNAKRQEAFDAEVAHLIELGAKEAYAPEFARQIWAAGKNQQKKRGFFVRFLHSCREMGKRARAIKALAEARAEVLQAENFQPTPQQIQMAQKASAAAAASQKRYADMVARERAKRVAARELRAQMLSQEIDSLLKAPLMLAQEKQETLRKYARTFPRYKWEKVEAPTVKNVMASLAPYRSLGADMADPCCWSIVQCGKIVATHPKLSAEIYAWVLGSARKLCDFTPIRQFIGNLTFLVDYYPEEALVAELKTITSDVALNAATITTSEEAAKLREMASSVNCRSSSFYKLARLVKKAATGTVAAIAGGIGAAADATCKFAEKISESAATGVFKVVMKCFQECLVLLRTELGAAIHLVDMLLDRIKVWYNNLLAKLDSTLSTLGNFSCYALGLLLGLGICNLIEKCVGSPGTICNLFSAAIFAAIAIKSYGGWDEVTREMTAMCTAMATSMFGRHRSVEGNTRSVPILSSMITAMTTFGTGLCKFNGEAVIEIGKLAGACHQMRMGKEALREFASTIMYYLGRLADKITGRETVFFSELSTLVGMNVQAWIHRARGAMLESFHTDPGCAAFGDVVARLVADGHKLQVGINGIPRKLSMDYAQLIGLLMKDLMELHKKLVSAGSAEGRRKEPAWIYLWGPRHCGKSNYMTSLGIDLCKHFDLPYTVCPRNGKDQFYSGYRQQTVFQVDDLSCVALDPPLEAEFINLVSCQDIALNMADVAEKPIYFRSPFIISSSNREDVPPGVGVRDVEAYRARKLCLVEMRRKPHTDFNPEDAMASSQGRLKDPMTQTLLAGQTEESSWMEMGDLTTEIINMVARHRDAQDKLQAASMRQRAQVDPVMLASEKFLKSEAPKVYLDFPRIELEKAGLKVEGDRKGLFVDNELYLMQPDFTFMVHKINLEGYQKLWSERMRRSFVPTVANDGYLNHSSQVVSGFLRSLVNGDCAVLNVNSLSSTATACQQRIFESLQMNERVYLRALQVELDRYLADIPENPYSNSAWVKVLGTIASGRQFLVDHGCGILLISAALILVMLSAWGFWKIFISLFTGSMSLAAAITGVSEVDMKAQYNSGGQDKGYRSRNIPVQHRYMYTRSQEENGMLPAARLCVAIFTPGGDFVSAMQYKNKSVMLTRHQAMRFNEGEQLTLVFASTGESQLVRWHKYHMRENVNSEIVTWLAPSLPQLPHDLKDLFLEDKEVEMPNHFKAMGYVLRQDSTAFHYDTLDTFAAVDKTPLPLKGIVADELYMHEIPEKITFHYESRNHDCGMLLLCQLKGKMKVVGLLVAGKDKTSWADILPNPNLAELKSQIEYFPKFGEAENGYFKVGYVAKSDAPTMPKKTNMVPVPAILRVPCDVPIKEPSIISSVDKRCPQGVDPPLAALKKKFSEPMAELEQEILDEVAGEILDTWYDCEDHVLQDIDLHTAINGIPAGGEEEQFENFVMKTSPGYPYYKENRATGSKGKHAYFEECDDGTLKIKESSIAAELYENLVQFTKEEVPELVVIECPKDELLPARKIKVGACRLFEILPFHYNLFLRVKSGSFVRFLQRNRHRLPCQVGTNAYSREWGHLLSRLMKPKTLEAINCDYSGFDGLLNAQLIECIAKMINRLYALSGESDVSQAQRYNMLMALFGRYALVGDDLYKVNCGLPSGFALTVIVNSIFNEILIRYTYKKLAPKIQRNSFGVNVCLLVYGDDNLISCSPLISKWFTGEAIRVTLAEKKIRITDGSDKDAPTIEAKGFHQLDFLKRKFLKLETGIVQAPLDRSAIFSSLYWLTPDKSKFRPDQKASDFEGDVDVVEELILNVNVALVELYLHNDRQEFERVRQFYVHRLPLATEQFRTWAFCESFHSAQQTGMSFNEPAKILDLLVGPGFARFMRVSEQGNQAHFYTPVLGVCGPFYKLQEQDFFVSMIPLKPGEVGVYIPVTVGDGIGAMPTKKWVQNFYSPTKLKNYEGYSCLNLLKENIESGKRLIFRSPAPYVAANAALIAFGSGAHLLNEKDALVHYRNSIPESVDGLERYFDAPIPPANVGRFYLANGETYAALCNFKDGEVLSYDGLPTQILNAASRDGKLPCIVAQSQRAKFVVAMCCDSKMCPHHKVTHKSYEEAFRQCWQSKCKTKACQVSPWYGTKLS